MGAVRESLEQIERFELRKLLKTGQGIETWEACEVVGDVPVIIKAVERTALSGSARLRLEHEADVLKQVGPPLVAPVVDVGQVGDCFYLAMVKLEGSTLDSLLKERRSLEIGEVLELAVQILKTLVAVHDNGIVHGDIKPANILVSETEFNRFTLLDFGLARSKRLERSIREQPAGTVRYLSPEQAGLLKRSIGPTSDLYSLGATLYEALAGEPLRRESSAVEVLREMLRQAAPELSSRGLVIPRALEEAVARMVRIDPNDRYQTAEGALYDFSLLLERWKSGERSPALVVGTKDIRRNLTEPSLVGRDRELRELSDLLSRTQKGERHLCLVEAPSGGGKTRLLDELVVRAGRRGAWVLRGQALESSVLPLQALTGISLELLSESRHNPPFAAYLREKLADYRAVLTSAVPELGLLFPESETVSDVLIEHGEKRTATALAALLDSLGTAQRPAVVIIDDAQWLDSMTLQLLKAWSAGNFFSSKRDCSVMLVVAFRDGEVGAGHPLRTLEATNSVHLGPLNRKDIGRLVESMAGRLPETVADLVADLSQGNAFLASEVLAGLVETRALVWDDGQWLLDEAAMERAQSSRKAAASLTRRLDLLSPQTLRVISCAAVLGREFELELVCALSQLDSHEVIPELEGARQKHLLWSDNKGETYRFVHDRLREAVLERLQEGDLKTLHVRAAEYLERAHPGRFYDLAYHFGASGDHERALPFALKAADDSYKRYALDLAEGFYHHAGLARSCDPDTRLYVLNKLGEVQMCRGKYEDSRRSFDCALEIAGNNEGRAEIMGQLGELAIKEGKMELAASYLEEAIDLLGCKIAKGKVGYLGGLLKELMVQALHTRFPNWFLGRGKAKDKERQLRIADLLARLGFASFFTRSLTYGFYIHLRQMNQAERFPPSKQLGTAYSVHAVGMASIPPLRDTRGPAYAERSLAVRRELGDEWGVGQTLNFYGLNLYSGGHFARAIAKFKESLPLLERTGDRWHTNISANHIALCYYRLGSLEEAAKWARRAYASAVEIGDCHAPGMSLMVLSLATGGIEGQEELARNLESDEHTSVQTRSHLLIGLGAGSIYQGDWQKGILSLERAWDDARESGIRNAYISSIPGWLVTAYRTAAQQAEAYNAGGRELWIQKAQALLKAAKRLAWRFPNERPHVYREEGLLEALQGRVGEAKEALAASLEAATKKGARLETAKSSWELANLGRVLGWPGAEEQLEKARSELLALGADFVAGPSEAIQPATTSLSLVERFSTVLEEGRSIASSLSKPDLYLNIKKAATALLRAEKCLVFELGEEGLPRLVCTDGGETWSQALLQQALELGKPVTLVEGLGQASESVLMNDIRSALCAPFFARGKTAGCFYVFHRQIDGLFGPEEERLANYIATLTGAALENTEGFLELTELSRTLESRVEIRTAELAQTTERLAVTLRSIGEGVIVVGPEGRILSLNRHAELLTGHTEEGAVGRPLESVYRLTEEQSGQVIPVPRSGFAEIQSRQGVLHNADGDSIPVGDTIAPITNEDGRALGVVLAFHDLTQQREIEQSRIRSSKLESLGVLAGGLAHDFNNLLTTIRGNLGLLELDLEEGSEQMDVLQQALMAVDRSAELAGRLLTFSRGGDPVKEVVSISRLLEEAGELAFSGSQVKLELELAEELWSAELDQGQIRQVINSILLNAVQASSEGDVVRVTAQNVVLDEMDELPPGRYLKIGVIDQGVGISAENLGRIFDPYFTTRELGSGLGLTTAYSIVRRHGGAIEVDSELGEGSTFAIYLPAWGESGSIEKPALKNPGRPSVLVLEDEVQVRELLSRMLERLGYEAVACEDGKEVLERYKERPFDFVILDLTVPGGLGGAKTFSRLRELDPEVHGIVSSGYSDDPVMADYRAYGFRDALPKPYNLQALQAVLGAA